MVGVSLPNNSTSAHVPECLAFVQNAADWFAYPTVKVVPGFYCGGLSERLKYFYISRLNQCLYKPYY